MVTPVVTVFLQGLRRSTAAAIELLGEAFSGIVVSDRFSAYNHLPLEQRQLCWAHVICDLTAIAERTGASAEIGGELLHLQRELFEHWHHHKEGAIDWPPLRRWCQPIQLAFEHVLQRVADIDNQEGERTPWAKTVRICRSRLLTVTTTLRQHGRELWPFLEKEWMAHHRGDEMPSLVPDP